ncbi:DsbA family oxidoreductase [Neobacillus citreus]|uniref:DsbA family oxidoreductase n=1 Tax=Neobacillus citreus TaxID=2833578 RepID=UPI0030B81AA6
MGKKRLEDAIQKVNFPVEVVYRCFELDPTSKRDVDYNIYEALSKKYGMSVEQAKANSRNLEKMAAEVGLEFNFDTQILTNTFDAHRLVMFANKQGLMHEMTDRILRAYFTEGKHIGDHTTLVQLAEEVGLNGESVKEMLSSTDMSGEVREDEGLAAQYGIRSIPFFILNKKYSLTGAQPTETFIQALNQIKAEESAITDLGDQDGGLSCDENGCEIPKK